MARILVVDDEDSIRLLYEQELLDEGYDVRVAQNGKECLQALEEEAFDVVILDIKMPQMDGIEALGKIVDRESILVTVKVVPTLASRALTSFCAPPPFKLSNWTLSSSLSTASKVTIQQLATAGSTATDTLRFSPLA